MEQIYISNFYIRVLGLDKFSSPSAFAKISMAPISRVT